MAYIISHITGIPYKEMLAMYLKDERLGIRFNIAPSQDNMVVAPDDQGKPVATVMKWGNFVRFKPGTPPTFLINARSETAPQKKTFSKALMERRVLVPADGFFEWKRENGRAIQAYYFTKKDQGAYFMAGISWSAEVDQPSRYIVLTTSPNELLQPIHDRMPVIFDEAKAAMWMDKTLTGEEVLGLCRSYPATEMTSYPVSDIVNSAKNDVPECVVPVMRTEASPKESQGTLF